MRRTFALVAAPMCLVLALSACGSNMDPGPTSTTVPGTEPGTGTGTASPDTPNGQQAPGPGGNNPGGDDNPSPSSVASDPGTTPSGGSTADTQEKIGDQSP